MVCVQIALFGLLSIYPLAASAEGATLPAGVACRQPMQMLLANPSATPLAVPDRSSMRGSPSALAYLSQLMTALVTATLPLGQLDPGMTLAVQVREAGERRGAGGGLLPSRPIPTSAIKTENLSLSLSLSLALSLSLSGGRARWWEL
jgi:hypothetical protein